MNDETENKNALATQHDEEAQNILDATREGPDKLLKFNKGDYKIGEVRVPLGTEFLAHATAWTKAWIKFEDGKVTDRKLYRIARGERPVQRETLDDFDEAAWPIGYGGKPSDPWVLQHLLPLESIETGEVVIFVTSSVGGRVAVDDVCREYAQRRKKGQGGQPIIRLAVADMPTKNFGNVPRPEFTIVRWEDTDGGIAAEMLVTAVPLEAAKKTANKRDLDDDIPF